ncbi:putative mutt/nudix hydrolase [Hibiscus syriacus]|uniref:Mutt/nudix hydrolase n=1 Tax=Hibiscus syriacus TaxID=106335 RepID=A0A6A2X1X5_HIBSY|nr:putative mutt/nudix hydrolase [Hibiscus syriacus]
MKLCKKFYNGEECPYGDRCNFLHEDLLKFSDDMGRFRESSAISIGTTCPPAGHGTVSDQFGGNWPVKSSSSDAFQGNTKPVYPVYWKTKLCTKWEITGHCPFGEKCHFAHGQAELQGMNGRVDGDFGNSGSGLTRNSSVSSKIHSLPANDPPPVTLSSSSFDENGQAKKCLLKWKRRGNH